MAVRNAAEQTQADTADSSPEEICSRAVAVLDGLLGQPAASRLSDIDRAERLTVCLRNSLIERLRAGDAAQKARVHPALTQVNMAVSLLVGVEYPAAGVQEKPLKEARDTLQDLLDQGWLARLEVE
jgi:hypothetical protein